MSSIYDHNRRAWDEMARHGQRFTRAAADAAFADPLAALDSRGWLGDVRGKRVLCLAAGGGKAGALFAAAGAIVTVVDLSPEMLALDRQVAAERGLNLRVVEASMDDLAGLADGEFDLVSQPVSTCYVPRIEPVYREVARVLAPGGVYVSQHKQPVSLQADIRPSAAGYELIEPYDRQGPLPQVQGSLHREAGTLEFLHTWEQLLGGLCRAGFVVEDLSEPSHADREAPPGGWGHRSRFAPPYVRIKARRLATPAAAARKATIWTPA